MDFNFNFGEMTLYEREKLFNIISKKDPDIILECGSGVGASTFIMVNASNKNTKIYSCDPIREPKITSPKLFFHKITSKKLISNLIKNNITPDLIFFDGPEDPNVALDDFKELENFVDVNTIFMMHDWCTNTRKYDGAISTKALLLKPYINSLDNWELIEEIDGENYKEGKESVGLCLYKKIF